MSNALTITIDVPNIHEGVTFYVEGLGLTLREKLAQTIYLLEFAGVRVYICQHQPGTRPFTDGPHRDYSRHWTPVHLDLEVTDLDAALESAIKAGAVLEGRESDPKWGDIATLSDPFGNGFCLIKPAETDAV